MAARDGEWEKSCKGETEREREEKFERREQRDRRVAKKKRGNACACGGEMALVPNLGFSVRLCIIVSFG